MVNFFIIILTFLNFSAFSNDKLEINADQFTYDKDNTEFMQLEMLKLLIQNLNYLLKVFVNNSSKVISARENVKVFNIDGTVLTAEKLLLIKFK